MASLSLCPQFETNLTPNRKVIEVLLQLKSAKAYGENYIKVVPHIVRYLLRNHLLTSFRISVCKGSREKLIKIQRAPDPPSFA